MIIDINNTLILNIQIDNVLFCNSTSKNNESNKLLLTFNGAFNFCLKINTIS